MLGVNRVFLGGTVGADPEVKNINGKSLAVFRMATNRRFNKNGEWQKETQWHTIESWGEKADLIAKYVKKGSRLLIEGELKVNEYTTKEGDKRKDWRITCLNINLLDKMESQNSGGQAQSDVENEVRSYTSGSDASEPTETVTADSNSFKGGVDDEMPF